MFEDMKPWRLTALNGLCFLTSVSLAQSFNIDLDIGSGSALVGNGAPSAAFGAASGQAGFWNRIDSATHTSQWTLAGLDEVQTSARMTNTFTGGGGRVG
ncbi:MAG TPA: hypothetical protein PKA27_07425, partial [Fimbriimonadaceae bacterium]|nr:hypothetical protein [Fimbriimonadaceae bacterium]